ncbi:tryptophan--tRNA ligase, chloroplastic/mitochondrial isoform X2 [Primulina huaijiensis]|uniref:tryptophan--tRNA ligase, chloroplastic/mitochondrial isoform X2 n=1 Tax=Primulina huaijiensis TaxID=1492673 RepID=UPI003CC6FB31
MGRSLLSHFSILSNISPRSISSILPNRVHLYNCSSRTSVLLQRRIQIGGSFRCLCSVAVSKPSTSENSSSSVKKRIVSGVQPTGSIHLGNYLGAIKNWIELQNTYETLFFIVDLHAITLPYDASQLSKATRDTAAIYLACGVDLSRGSIFVQSHVRAHVELMWLLSSASPIGWLNRMIQFKEKSRKTGDDNVGVALLTYPVLMASDILLYQMSKSAPSDQSRINLLDSKDVIANKIKRCKTDSFPGLEFDNPERPECNNLLSVYQLITYKTKQEVEEECKNMNWGVFKTLLTDALIEHLHPIQVHYAEIMSDATYLDGILAEGASKAETIAEVTINNIYQAMGFLRRQA